MSEPAGDGPLLLHSLETVSDLILRALDLAAPERIVEIGSESGGFTLALAGWAREHGATLVSVDPQPAPVVGAAAAGGEPIEIVTEPSPGALEGIAPAGAYVVDGDHNFWTVSRELERIFAGDAAPLVVLHDVAWPWARRDLYYAPERIPDEGRREHTDRGGVALDEPGVVAGGFRGRGAYAHAVQEGGERNGVLTAVEAFLEGRDDLRFARVPCIFGVGFLYPAGAPWADEAAALLAPYDESPLLATLERNRVALYLRVLELQDELDAARAAGDRTIADLQDQLGAVQAQNAALRAAAVEVS
jgi:hypothetical protein